MDKHIAMIYETMENMRQDLTLIKQQLNKKESYERYTTREVAGIAGCTIETINNHVRSGYLKVRYPMAKKRFDAKDVEKYLKGIF